MGKIIRQATGKLEETLGTSSGSVIGDKQVGKKDILDAEEYGIADYWFAGRNLPKKYDGKHVRLTLELLEDK